MKHSRKGKTIHLSALNGRETVCGKALTGKPAGSVRTGNKPAGAARHGWEAGVAHVTSSVGQANCGNCIRLAGGRR